MAICKDAVIGRRCILSQNVTLGLGTDPATGKHGGPTLEDEVHVGPGATIIGPITIGGGSKVMPGCVVVESIPPGSRVEAPRPNVVARARAPGLKVRGGGAPPDLALAPERGEPKEAAQDEAGAELVGHRGERGVKASGG